jgi:sulfite reductase (NADPH) flavoprotein alpha-component
MAQNGPYCLPLAIFFLQLYSMGPGKDTPIVAELAERKRLSGKESDREICQLTITAPVPFDYEPGDWLGILPKNSPEFVEKFLKQLGASGEEPVAVRGMDGKIPLRAALADHWEIGRVNPECGNLAGVIETLLPTLKSLQPRMYSIASSPLTDPNSVQLVVATETYQNTDGEKIFGVASGYLNRRLRVGDSLRCYPVKSRFRLPEKGEVDIIMVGPGTGIAPFVGFLGQRWRERSGGKKVGRSWLFFGDRHQRTDFIFRETLEDYLREGLLSRLDLAFSRDQEQKIYVQDRILENGAELYRWIETGAHFYVCGNADRMAKDVEMALVAIFALHGGLTRETALARVEELRRSRHYQKDVY